MVSADKLVTPPVELEVQLNDTFQHYQVGVGVQISTDVVTRPIKWADCVQPRNSCTFAIFCLHSLGCSRSNVWQF